MIVDLRTTISDQHYVYIFLLSHFRTFSSFFPTSRTFPSFFFCYSAHDEGMHRIHTQLRLSSQCMSITPSLTG